MRRRQKTTAALTVVPFTPKPEEKRWTPESCLEELLADIKAGKYKIRCLAIHFFHDEGDRMVPHTYAQNMTGAEEIALAEVMKDRALKRWRE